MAEELEGLLEGLLSPFRKIWARAANFCTSANYHFIFATWSVTRLLFILPEQWNFAMLTILFATTNPV